MATIVVQYDPLAYTYSKNDNYGPTLIEPKRLKFDASNIPEAYRERM